jgi:hypothetical protein
MPPLSTYYPVAVSELINFKVGTFVRFSARKPSVGFMGSDVTLTYTLDKGLPLVVSYSTEARQQTESLIHKLFSESEAAKLKEASRILQTARWDFAAVHYGMICNSEPESVIWVDGHYWLPQTAQTFLEKKLRKPDKLKVTKLTSKQKKDFDQRVKDLSGLFEPEPERQLRSLKSSTALENATEILRKKKGYEKATVLHISPSSLTEPPPYHKKKPKK